MNSNNKINEKLFNYFERQPNVPQKVSETIMNTDLKQNKKSIFDFYNFKKVGIATLSIITATTSFVAATNFIKNRFIDNKGVDTAVEHGYVHQISNTYSNSENNKIKITDIIMDDYTLDINLSAEFDKKIGMVGSFEKIDIPDLIITDDQNKILYSSNEETSIKFCNENGISSDYNNITTKTSSSLFIIFSDANYADFSLNLSASDNKFPLSKKIYVSFNTIELIRNKQKYKINGNWDIDINVPDKFLNRKSILYHVTNCNNDKVIKDSIVAEVYETGMNFKMQMYWGDYQMWHSIMNENRKKNILSSQLIVQEESYVENEKGEKFYPAQSTSSDGGYSFNIDGNLIKWETFNITKFNTTDKLKVVLTTIDNNEIIIELKK